MVAYPKSVKILKGLLPNVFKPSRSNRRPLRTKFCLVRLSENSRSLLSFIIGSLLPFEDRRA